MESDLRRGGWEGVGWQYNYKAWEEQQDYVSTGCETVVLIPPIQEFFVIVKNANYQNIFKSSQSCCEFML
jgi:roadblock/LC7 domain-containing protein